MFCFWCLLTAYLLSEYGLLPHKKKGWYNTGISGRAAHSVLFTALALLFNGALYGYLSLPWFTFFGTAFNGFWAIIFLGLINFLVNGIYTDARVLSAFPATLTFILKQLINVFCIFIIVPGITLTQTGSYAPKTWMLILLGAIALGRFTKILLYAVEKDSTRFSGDVCELPSGDETFMSTMQREGLYFMALLPGYAWIVFGVLWMLSSVYARKVRLIDVSKFALLGGSIAAIGIGLIIRMVIY
ncbi:hypothetical protein Dip518_001166 [Parelusimicrobium proximum]|uniref:hypothetical protein n=1 Tax=Parelusimicrobium proximum TaxID=3228953 RepID=UPI003D169A62